MSDMLIFYIAVVVFVLMSIGLALTVVEFRHGKPAEQEEEGDDLMPLDRRERLDSGD
ncbi:MAG: hypothetical protein R3323_06375 [Wenzhouxiangellaceae bacterium]|nr:hypothetical protein [Wenzhouxiangellaceae bacterium]